MPSNQRPSARVPRELMVLARQRHIGASGQATGTVLEYVCKGDPRNSGSLLAFPVSQGTKGYLQQSIKVLCFLQQLDTVGTV